jgi:hypothetical protein
MANEIKERPEVSIARKTARALTIIALLFQLIEPFIVTDHNLKGTSLFSLFILVSFGAYSLVSRRKL